MENFEKIIKHESVKSDNFEKKTLKYVDWILQV